MKKTQTFTLIALIAATLALSACNTIAGIGDDARAAGNAISNAARGNKTY